MKRVLLLLLPALILPDVVASQTGTIVGNVEDASTGRPLPGANILLVEIVRGAATESDGRFVIPAVRTGIYTARVSFVGYSTHEKEVMVGTDTLRFDVSLEPDFARYDEILVTSIATERSRATADVAVSRIDTREFFENNAYRDVSQLVTGKVSGLSVQPASGNVAGGIRLILRTLTGLNGNSQPTIYVDGVRIDGGEGPAWSVGGQSVSLLAQLNPGDIESIDILKGPAGAALYGTSGSNGVVLITTSKGAFGSPVAADYRFTLGQNSQEREYDVFTASTPDAANAIFRDGRITEHTLEIRGGSENVRFFTSYGNRSEDGHIRNNAQERQSFRANVEAVPSPKFRLGASAFFLRNDVLRPHNDNNADGYLANVTVLPRPYLFADSAAIENLKDVQEHSRFIGQMDAEYSPVPRLTVRASVGYDGTEVRNDNFVPAGFQLSRSSTGHRFSGSTVTNQTTYNLDGRFSYSISRDLAVCRS